MQESPCDSTPLEAVWWCWLHYYYFLKAGQGDVEKKEESAEVADFWRRMWSSLHISLASRPHWRCCSRRKLSWKHFAKVFFFFFSFPDNISFISDVEFLIAAAARGNKDMRFHLSEMLFLAVTAATSYGYTDTFGALAETSKRLSGIAQKLIPIRANSRAAAIYMQSMLTSFAGHNQQSCRHQLRLAGCVFSAEYIWTETSVERWHRCAWMLAWLQPPT